MIGLISAHFIARGRNQESSMHYRILFLFLVTVLFTGCDSSNPEDDITLSLEGSFSCYQQSNGGLSDGVNQCAANSVCHADTGCSVVDSLIGNIATQQYALLPIDVSVGPQQACRGPFLPLGATYSRDDDSVVYLNDQGEETPYHDRYRSLAVEAADGSCSARVVADPCPEGTVVENSGSFPTLAICVPIVTCDELTPCPATADQCTENQCLGGECIEVSRVNLDCDDGDACTQNDICDAFNVCIGEAIVCAGQLACANEVCQDGACVLTEQELEGTLCEDGDPCTTRSECDAASTCATVNLLDCSDGEVCTDDSCDSAILEGSPCVNAALADATPCDDESLCSENDACVGGICSGDEVVCADPGPCQVGSCDPLLGCVSELLANGLACPTGVCIDGACMDQVFVCNDVAPEFCDTINGSYGFYRCNISEGQSLGAVELVESCGALALCQIDTDPHCTAPQACADDTDCGPLETCVNNVCVQADSDGDGTIDALDNCPAVPNVGQEDRDGDGVGDGCDNCPDDANADQLDTDGDDQGDACEIIVPDEICDNGLDDDGDTNVDCDDTDCLGIGNCPDETGNIVGGELLCDNLTDDDNDGFTDCADPDCSAVASCVGGNGGCLDNTTCAEGEVCVASTCRPANGDCTTFAVEVAVAQGTALIEWWPAVDGPRRQNVPTGTYESQAECSATVFGHDACTCHISDGVNYPCTFLNGVDGPVGCTHNGSNNN